MIGKVSQQMRMSRINSTLIKTMVKFTWAEPGITFLVHDPMAHFHGRPCVKKIQSRSRGVS